MRWVAIESPGGGGGPGGHRPSRAARRPLDVLYRLNPDVVPETLAGLAVGAGASKFGMTETELAAAIEAGGGPHGPLRPRGIHLHVGSQLGAVDAWRDAVRRALAVAALWRGSIETFDTLDVGGGFPVFAAGTPAPTLRASRASCPRCWPPSPAIAGRLRLAVEPGRFLVARAGWLVARVLHVRDRGGRQVVLDAGMTELIRPALYGARHPILALTSSGRPLDRDPSGAPGPPGRGGAWTRQPTRVEGPICESTDSLGVHDLPPLRRGDLVAIADAGAYAASQSSTYNGRPRPPQVLLDDQGGLTLGRRRLA